MKKEKISHKPQKDMVCVVRGGGVEEEIAKSNSAVSQSPVGCRLEKTCGLGALNPAPADIFSPVAGNSLSQSLFCST
jgi:hypothetical protein